VGSIYGFAYTEAALDFFESSVPAKFRKQIKKKIEALAASPHPPGSKKLEGAPADAEPVFRIRSGDYRVLYLVRSNPDHIVILDIDHRKDIYR